jgi:aryl hydrocarbon receptor nuclear translocator-like protein 1
MQRLISTHVEASKIGRQIAEEVLDSQRPGGDSLSDSSPSPDAERTLPPQISQSSAEVLALQFMKRQLICTPSIFLSSCC